MSQSYLTSLDFQYSLSEMFLARGIGVTCNIHEDEVSLLKISWFSLSALLPTILAQDLLGDKLS